MKKDNSTCPDAFTTRYREIICSIEIGRLVETTHALSLQ